MNKNECDQVKNPRTGPKNPPGEPDSRPETPSISPPEPVQPFPGPLHLPTIPETDLLPHLFHELFMDSMVLFLVHVLLLPRGDSRRRGPARKEENGEETPRSPENARKR